MSPDATHIAYATFHDEDVMEFTYYIYGTPGSLDSQYPTEVTIKYPKVCTACFFWETEICEKNKNCPSWNIQNSCTHICKNIFIISR